MELIKKQIHMNQFKGNVTTQITLDDDFIVPDTMDDMAQVMLDTGEIQIESVKNQGEKVAVKGKLEFQVLYRKEGGGLQTLGGSIPFDETINAPDLEEKDYVGLNWMLEDLNAEMINSRKLGVQAIITLQVRIETLRDVEAAVDVDMGNGGFAAQTPGETAGPAQIETLKRTVNVAAIAVRRKDTYRMKEEISLTGGFFVPVKGFGRVCFNADSFFVAAAHVILGIYISTLGCLLDIMKSLSFIFLDTFSLSVEHSQMHGRLNLAFFSCFFVPDSSLGIVYRGADSVFVIIAYPIYKVFLAVLCQYFQFFHRKVQIFYIHKLFLSSPVLFLSLVYNPLYIGRILMRRGAMSLRRPAAGGESCKAGFFFISLYSKRIPL